jgi:phosphatidylglycerophosphatase A
LQRTENPVMRSKTEFFTVLLSTGLYSGYSPFAPGTAGTVVGVLLYLFIIQFSPVYYIILIIALFFIGVRVSGNAEKIFGKKDHGAIVIDEIEGFLIAMFLVPKTIFFIISGFLLFRLLDIIKPFSRFEQLEGGLGVMIDDIIAAVFTNVLLQLSRFLII